MRALEAGAVEGGGCGGVYKKHLQLPWCRANQGLIAALIGIKVGMSNSWYKNHHRHRVRGKLEAAMVVGGGGGSGGG